MKQGQWLVKCAALWLLVVCTGSARAQPLTGQFVEQGHLVLDSKRSVPLPAQGGSWTVVLSQELSRELPKNLPIGVFKGYEQARFMFDNAVSPTWLVGLRHNNPNAPVPIVLVRYSLRAEAWRSSVCDSRGEAGVLQELYGTLLNGNSQRCSIVSSISSLTDFQASTSSSAWASFFRAAGSATNLPSTSYLNASWRMQEFGGHNLVVEALVRADALGGTSDELMRSYNDRPTNPTLRTLTDWLSTVVTQTADVYFKGQKRVVADLLPVSGQSLATSKPPSPPVQPTASSDADRADRARLQAIAESREKELDRLRQQLAQVEASRLVEAQRTADVPSQAGDTRQQAFNRQQVLESERSDNQRLALGNGKRKALVIGNDLYRNVPKLDNARSDARSMGQSLESLGFQVTVALDLTERGMKDTLRRFKSGVQGGDEVVVFYAGHGVQLGAANYLLPVDIAANDEAEVRDFSIQMQRILDDMQEQKTKFMLLIVDACRDNPFKSAGRTVGGRGLAPTAAATGQMVIFSAGAGQQALDRLGPADKHPNGVFTRMLLKEMQKPSVPIHQVIRNVRDGVADLASSIGHEQVPALYDQSRGDFFLKP